MNNNDNFVNETENVVVTTEETPKTFTQEDVDRMVKEKLDEVLPGKIARIEKKYERKYGGLISTLEAGTGKKGVDELDDTFRGFYSSKGVQLTPKAPEYTEEDINYLGKRDADQFIAGGIEEVDDELERLTEKGAEKMTKREKVRFTHLMEYVDEQRNHSEYAKMGVPEEVYTSEEFKALEKQFNKNTPKTEVYDFYRLKYPKKEHFTLGSMKNNSPGDVAVKEYYSPEEAKKFKPSDYDRIPGLHEAVVKSMAKWRK